MRDTILPAPLIVQFSTQLSTMIQEIFQQGQELLATGDVLAFCAEVSKPPQGMDDLAQPQFSHEKMWTKTAIFFMSKERRMLCSENSQRTEQ